MFHIAVCDDHPPELEILLNYTKEYIELNQLDAAISRFNHPDALLIACEIQQFSLYILDIVMPMVNGITVGKEIRNIDRQAQIIYTTNEPSFALEAYAANPVSYLIKPIDKSSFFDTLDIAISKLKLEDNAIITIKTKNGLHIVPIFTIVCCEYVKRSAQYTLTNGETINTLSLQESFADHIAPLLRDKRFLQPHNAFVINMSWVERFAKECFTMRSGMNIPISAKQYSTVRDKFMDYLLVKEI